jgi:hypothetical protein
LIWRSLSVAWAETNQSGLISLTESSKIVYAELPLQWAARSVR